MTRRLHELMIKGRVKHSQQWLVESTSLSWGVVNRWTHREVRAACDYQSHPRDEQRTDSLAQLLRGAGRTKGDGAPAVGDEVGTGSPEVEVDYEKGSGQATFDRPITVEEAIEHLEIDTEKWKIVRPKVGTFEGQAKVDVVVGRDEEGEPIIEQEHRVKQMYKFEFALVPRPPEETEAFAEKLFEQVAERSPVFRANVSHPTSDNVQRVLIPDIHLGKDGFQSKWGIEKATERVLTVVDEFATIGEQHDVDRFSLPLGHDLLHIDSEHIGKSGTLHATSSGTPVERSHPWIELFLGGCDLSERIVARLLEVAPVDVSIIPGNHSGSSEVAIGKFLMALFRDSPDVTFDLTADRERYYRWGVNVFMDTHGDTCPFSDLPLNFATLNGKLWGEARWREVNTGHKHISKKKPVGLSTNEKNGCMVRISPSLSPQDAWHKKYHYHGMPGAESYLYNKKRPGPFASYQSFY